MAEKNEQKKLISGSEVVVKCLLAEGVDVAFGYPGGAIMPLYDVLMDYEKEINHILTRHEQGAVHAAQGYARVSGKVGVCIATSGPGATNLITGIADAQIDSTPIVCITGQVFSTLLGTDAFQETDVVGISMPITKWNYQVTRAEEIPEVLTRAFFIARTGRPGPVLIDITKDALFGKIKYIPRVCTSIRSYVPSPFINENKVKEAAELINSAKKPLVLFGQGVILGNAENEFKEFIEKAGLPSAWTILGASALDSDHKLNVGMLGMHGNYAPNILTNECDVLIAVGMRFDDRVTGKLSAYAKQAKIIHLDIDVAEIDKNVKTDVAILGDCKKSLKMLTNLINKNSHESWLKDFHAKYEIEYQKVIKNDFKPEGEILSMAEVIDKLNEISKGNAVVVTDVGQHQMVACRYAKHKKSRSLITSGGLGTMGFGLPTAIGAKFGAPERQVVVVMGDGGFQMTIQELGTIFQSDIDVKLLLLNNEFLGMVRQWQDLFFEKRYASTTMKNPDFQMIARGYGLTANKVMKRENLHQAVKEMFEHKGSYLLEVMVGKEHNVFPMIAQGTSVSDIRLE